MFVVLYSVNNTQRSENKDRCPESKVSKPYLREGLDLERGLEGGDQDESQYYRL